MLPTYVFSKQIFSYTNVFIKSFHASLVLHKTNIFGILFKEYSICPNRYCLHIKLSYQTIWCQIIPCTIYRSCLRMRASTTGKVQSINVSAKTFMCRNQGENTSKDIMEEGEQLHIVHCNYVFQTTLALQIV